MTAALTVVVHPADPPAVTARRADRALEGTGARVIYRRENDSVWIADQTLYERATGDYWHLVQEGARR